MRFCVSSSGGVSSRLIKRDRDDVVYSFGRWGLFGNKLCNSLITGWRV